MLFATARSISSATGCLASCLSVWLFAAACSGTIAQQAPPFVVVLGIAQDGGAPQTGVRSDPRWQDGLDRPRVSSIGLVAGDGREWLFDATPDFPDQVHHLDAEGGSAGSSLPDGVFLTHAHIGHYTGLMFLGHESAGAQGIDVFAMPRMAGFLETNGPWSQLVRYNNITLRELRANEPVPLTDELIVTPILVPHRQEYSEVVAFRIDGPNGSVLYMPDVDSWAELDSMGTPIESLIGDVDYALLDATFFADGEIPGRDMSTFPHPFVRHSLERFQHLSADERAKIHFIHLNHTNPALRANSDAALEIEAAGMSVARRGQRFGI